jgi:phosphohistidine phosphatase
MKHLLLLRHAKSNWEDAGNTDFDRPLAARGERDAPRMGEALRQLTPLPDYVLSSPATRARQTTLAVVQAANLTVEPHFAPNLYAASADALLAVVRRLPVASACTLLVGHNNGLEDLLGRLTGQWRHMPTAALACITLDVDHWSEIEEAKGELAWFLTPKHLSERDES